MGCCSNKPHSTQLSRFAGNNSQTEDISTFIRCPYCLQDFYDDLTTSRFSEHLLVCKRHSNFIVNEDLNCDLSKDSSYGDKIEWLRNEINKIRIPWHSEHMKFRVKRGDIIKTSMKNILGFSTIDFHKEFQVNFDGELAMDAGGLLREWFTILTKKLFSEKTELFKLANTKCVNYTFPNIIDEARINEYIFTGKLIGKAIFENVPIYCPFTPIIFKHIVDEEIQFKDLSQVDYELYNSLLYILENPVKNVIFETFTVEKEHKGVLTKYSLKEHGSEIMVDDDNKSEYANLRWKFETTDNLQAGLMYLLHGFYSVIPKNLVSIFTSQEFELLLCGLPYIELDDWRKNTIYRGDFTRKSRIIKWFWRILRHFSQKKLSDLITFVTGTPRLPVEGFSSLKTMRGDPAKFTIESIPCENDNALPRAHTCFNRLDLPKYTSRQSLKKGLLYVIRNHKFGFGIE
ncbi:unnamed protein product [Blepharisma stoltei]|uniref:HECT-type E3 ubiquitin transferase n=1 Tax=Blepharisma stoltei TaxID=1481888 RepID=A0AAU9K0U5_9CILI|nr:unnamed protein product [Blepharisma stoltei]